MVDLVKDRIDSDKAKEGIWVDIPNFARVRIRRWNNEDFRRRSNELRLKTLEDLRMKSSANLTDEQAFPIMVQAACETVITEWDSSQVTEGGKPVRYTPEKGFEVFSSPDWREEFLSIVQEATDREQFVVEVQEETVKKQ